jgi:hypothetical protein
LQRAQRHRACEAAPFGQCTLATAQNLWVEVDSPSTVFGIACSSVPSTSEDRVLTLQGPFIHALAPQDRSECTSERKENFKEKQ